MNRRFKQVAQVVSFSLLAAFALSSSANQVPDKAAPHAKHGAAMKDTGFGKPGDAKAATRVINVGMADSMRFTPGEIAVKEGETIKFVVKNNGSIEHEFVFGTEDTLKEHGEAMMGHPGVKMDHANSVQVAPGAVKEVLWKFTTAGKFHYGCMVPGHFQAGMRGALTVAKAK